MSADLEGTPAATAAGLVTPQEARRTQFVLLTMVAYLVLNAVLDATHGGWLPLTIGIAVIMAAFLWFAIRWRDRVMVRYVVFGVVAGIAELPIDAWLVHGTGTLKYPCDEPMLFASPAYMPFAWAVVLVQICAMGDWLADRIRSVAMASVLLAIFSGLYIPIFEHLANEANLWWYECTPTLLTTGAPLYVILAEVLLALPLVWMGKQAQRKADWWWIVLLGLVEGLVVMSLACFIAYPLVGRNPPSMACPPELRSNPCPPNPSLPQEGPQLEPISAE